MFQFAGATFVDLPGKAFKDPLAVPEDIQKINLESTAWDLRC